MTGPTPTPVSSDAELPASVDVVVIGGGIIGAASAYELAKRGHSVALFEKGDIAGEQSSRNWGWVRMALRDPREIPLMHVAMARWDAFADELAHDTGFTRSGIAFAQSDIREKERHERWVAAAEGCDVDCAFISKAQLAELMGADLGAIGAIHTPNDARAEPQWAAPAVVEGARSHGAKVFTHCAVRGLETEAGQIRHVVTERGALKCQSVVLAGGAWSRLFAGNLGVDVPQLKVLNTVMRTSPVPNGPETSAWMNGVGWRKRADGGYTVADGGSNLHGITIDSFRQFFRFLPALKQSATEVTPRLDSRFVTELGYPRRWALDDETVFERERCLDPKPSLARQKRFWKRAQNALTVLKGADVAQVWGGMIDVTPDIIPVISPVDTAPGLVIATGFSGHGFGLGPGAGVLIADLVTGNTPVVDPKAFRLSRFSDGTPLTLGGAF